MTSFHNLRYVKHVSLKVENRILNISCQMMRKESLENIGHTGCIKVKISSRKQCVHTWQFWADL